MKAEDHLSPPMILLDTSSNDAELPKLALEIRDRSTQLSEDQAHLATRQADMNLSRRILHHRRRVLEHRYHELERRHTLIQRMSESWEREIAHEAFEDERYRLVDEHLDIEAELRIHEILQSVLQEEYHAALEEARQVEALRLEAVKGSYMFHRKLNGDDSTTSTV